MKDIILKLLNKDASLRLGQGGSEEILAHPWFADLDLVALENMTLAPKLVTNSNPVYFNIDNSPQALEETKLT